MGRIIRPSGYFDEPGALAFWGMFALVFNKLFFNNRKVEVALLISLLFTLSAAYFVEGFLYVVLFYVRRAKTFIISILGILLTLFVIKYFAGDNEIIANYTTERFAHGEIRTSRTELAELAWNQFEKNPIFGVGAATFEEIGYMADNQFEVLAKDGIVGFIVTYLPFLIIVFRCRNKEVLSAVMILLLDYMQRPFHVNMIHNLIVYLFMILCLSKYGSKKKSIQYA
jgi:O-antigen ligase